MKNTLKGAWRVLASLAVAVAFVVSGLVFGNAASNTTGCTKQQAETVLDITRFTVEQVTCMAAEIELGASSPVVVAAACGPGLDAYLKDIEKFILAQQKAKALAMARHAAAAGADAGAPKP